MKIKYEDTLELISSNLKNNLINRLKDNNKQGIQTYLGLSGGSTPQTLYSLLAADLHLEPSLNFTIFLIDERFVDFKSSRNNSRVLKQLLIDKIQIKHNVRYVDFVTPPKVKFPEDGLIKMKELMQEIGEQKNSEVILVLGMGKDGHTASLFPNNAKYIDSIVQTQIQVFHTYVESQEEVRMTISPTVILNSSLVIVLLSGNEKGRTLNHVMNNIDPINQPISYFFRHPNISFYMDKEAFLQLDYKDTY